MKKYKVSVSCAVRNEAFTLRECLNSLVNQTYGVKEIIIVDDESTDGSTEIAKEFSKKYPFVKYHKITHDPDYILKSRVTTIAKATGDVILLADADAKYDEDYLEKCIKHLDKKGVGGALGKIRMWKKKNTFISKYKDVHYRVMWDDVENMKKIIATGRITPWVYKKKIYDDLGGYRKEAGWSADSDFSKRMIDKGYSIAYEPSVGFLHRWREGLFEVMSYALFWSRLDFGKKKSVKEMGKMLYFIAFPWLIVLSLFYPLIWLLVLGHASPMFLNGMKLYKKAGRMKISGRGYALLSPLVSYVTNVPYAYGYFSNYIWRH